MELETLFTTSKWEILQKISQKPFSPLQLSNQLNTTIANISQQLRLLEVAGLLDKEKVSTRESGKPRTLFSVKNDFSYLILISKEGAKKELLNVDKEKRIIMNSWLKKDADLDLCVYSLQKHFSGMFDSVEGVFRNKARKDIFVILNDSKELSKNTDKLKKSLAERHHGLKLFSRKEFVTYVKSLGSATPLSPFDVLLINNELLETISPEMTK